MTPRRRTRRSPIGVRLPAVAAGVGIIFAVGCASSPSPSSPPLTLEPVPLQASPSLLRPGAADRYAELLRAVERGNHDAGYAILLELIDRCSIAPLTQRALLLVATAEMDPRNRSPRLELAVEYAALLLEADADPWTRRLAESLYLIGHRLGGVRRSSGNVDVREVRWRAEQAAGRMPAPECEGSAPAATVASAAASGTDGASPAQESSARGVADGAEPRLPAFRGSSFPAVIAELRRQVEALEIELERLRRIARSPSDGEGT